MKQMIKSAFRAMGFEVRRVMPTQKRFTVAGINYDADPCSVGHEPQGELTGRGAVRLIRERGLKNLSILDMCCGVGVIGLTIFSELRNTEMLDKVSLADINIFNINSLERTLKLNGLQSLVGDQIEYWLSDSLKNVPRDKRFDLIVSNPPHFFAEDRTSNPLVPSRLAMYDADWSFHKSFYSQCHDYLTPRGEVWFLENGDAVNSAGLLPFIEANPNLQYVGEAVEPGDPVFFWMFSKRV
jgi:methylase of polypeptide subunit release factors